MNLQGSCCTRDTSQANKPLKTPLSLTLRGLCRPDLRSLASSYISSCMITKQCSARPLGQEQTTTNCAIFEGQVNGLRAVTAFELNRISIGRETRKPAS